MEQIILSNLIGNEKFARKVLPYLNEDLFHDTSERVVYCIADKYINQYNTMPTKEVIYTETSELGTLNESQFEETIELVKSLEVDDTTNYNWLIDQTEEFVKKRSIHNAIRESIHILDGDGKDTVGSIPGILENALGVSFDTAVGHDFIDDAKSRYELYHTTESRICFSIDYFNRITGGGLPPKTLNIIMAATGVGKSLLMCSMAADNLMDNKNVLYITLEMAEERISQRIDCNLLDVTMDELMELSEEKYLKKVENLGSRTKGKLVVKEYPTATASAAHFRHLLTELRVKKNFIPDIIYVDYLNICSSSRLKNGLAAGSYTYIKAIAEEVRGLAVENNVPIVSATQTNRDGIDSSDIDLGDVSESVGLPMTVDFMFALMCTEEMEEQGLFLVKQLKNRYGDLNRHKKFFIGVNKALMRVFDAPRDVQKNGGDTDGIPVMDNSEFVEKEASRSVKKRAKTNFEGFK